LKNKILICSDSFKNVSGLSYVALNFCKYFIDKNYEVAYCVISGSDCTVENLKNKGHLFYENLIDSKIYNCQNKNKNSSVTFNECLKEFKPTIVLSIHDLWQFENIMISCYRDTFTWIAYCPIESDFYSEYIINPTQLDPSIRKPLSTICKNIDYTIAYNEVGKQQLEKLGANVIGVLPNGLDDFYFEDQELNRQVVFKNIIKEDDFVFMTVGNNFNRKGIDYVIEAFARFLIQVKDKERYKLYIHGFIDTIDAGTDIKSMICELGIGNNLIMTNNQSISKKELYKRYRCCNCYIGLPLAEGYGYGFMESCINGLPIIYHNVGGITQYINKNNIEVGSVATYRPNNYFCKWKIPDINNAVQGMNRAVKICSDKGQLSYIASLNKKEGKKYLWDKVFEQLESFIDFDKISRKDIYNKISIKRII